MPPRSGIRAIPETAGELMERAGAAVAARGDPRLPGGAALRSRLRRRRERGRRAHRGAHPARGGARGRRDRRPGGRRRRDRRALRDGVPRRAAARGGRDRSSGSTRAATPVVAVDLPSGVDASTGEVAGAAVKADLTVTFHGRKVGLVVAPGRFHAGQVAVADIGLDPAPAAAVRATAGRCSTACRGSGAGDSKFTSGVAARRRRRPGHDLRARAERDGRRCARTPATSRSRCRRRVSPSPRRSRSSRSSGDSSWDERARDARRGPRARRRGRRRARPRSLRRGSRPRAEPPRGRSTCPVVVDADGLYGLEPVERERAARPDAACGRARAAARHRLGLGRGPPAGGGRPLRGAPPRRRPPEGARHDRARTGRPHGRLPTTARARSRPPARGTC